MDVSLNPCHETERSVKENMMKSHGGRVFFYGRSASYHSQVESLSTNAYTRGFEQ